MNIFLRIGLWIELRLMDDSDVHGKYLNRLGETYGMKRRLLESDRKFRRRILRKWFDAPEPIKWILTFHESSNGKLTLLDLEEGR